MEALTTVDQRIDKATGISERINQVKLKFIENFLELSHLLAEVYNNQYYDELGFDTFKEYVESSDLDINITAAYRMVNLANNSKLLDVPSETMAEIRPTKLLEIFSLNPDEHKETIHELLKEGDKNTVEEVKQKVKKAKGETGADVFYRFKVNEETSVGVIQPALDKAGKMFGDLFVNQATGEVFDPSPSTLFEMICADFNSSSNKPRA